MGFLSGLVTGAATSIDNQLKADMKRSEERAEGMAQYRVTRRRAALEAQDREKKDIAEVMGNLASLVDGDVDKAAQLYVSGGKNVAGATSLYQELLKNKQANKDIFTIDTFAKARAEPGKMTDYISKFITPLSTLPVSSNEVKGAGLYGALFKPDLSKSVMRQVEEQAPLPAAPTSDIQVTGAKIDRSGFLDAEAYAETIKQRERSADAETRAKSREARDVTAFDTNEKRLKQAMQIASAAAQQAKDKFASDADQRKLENARQKVIDLQTQSKLIQEAEAHVKNQKKSDLVIQKTEMEIAQDKAHPVFKEYQDMAVYASAALATGDYKEGYTKDDYTRLLDAAIEGAKKYATESVADDPTAGAVEFAVQSLDSIVQGAMKNELGMVPSESIEGKIEYAIEGNEVDYYSGVGRALQIVDERLRGPSTKRINRETGEEEIVPGTLPLEAESYLTGLKESNTQKLFNFATEIKADYANANANKRSKIKFVPFDTFASAVRQLKTANTSLSDAAAIKQWGKNNAKAGSVVPMNSAGTVFGVWTGSRFLQAKDMGR